MNRQFLVALGVGTVIMFYVFNLSHAVNDYGVKENSMTLSILAQSGSSGGGSGSGSSGGGSSSGGSSVPEGFNPDCWYQDNNHNGKNPSLYCNLQGKPKECDLYLFSKFDVYLGVTVFKYFRSINGEIGWKYESKSIKGLKETCPTVAPIGCTVYSCKEV